MRNAFSEYTDPRVGDVLILENECELSVVLEVVIKPDSKPQVLLLSMQIWGDVYPVKVGMLRVDVDGIFPPVAAVLRDGVWMRQELYCV